MRARNAFWEGENAGAAAVVGVGAGWSGKAMTAGKVRVAGAGSARGAERAGTSSAGAGWGVAPGGVGVAARRRWAGRAAGCPLQVRAACVCECCTV